MSDELAEPYYFSDGELMDLTEAIHIAERVSLTEWNEDRAEGAALRMVMTELERLRAVEKAAAALVAEYMRHRGLQDEFFDLLYALKDAVNGDAT